MKFILILFSICLLVPKVIKLFKTDTNSFNEKIDELKKLEDSSVVIGDTATKVLSTGIILFSFLIDAYYTFLIINYFNSKPILILSIFYLLLKLFQGVINLSTISNFSLSKFKYYFIFLSGKYLSSFYLLFVLYKLI